MGKHSKIGSAGVSLFICIPLMKSRPLILAITLKESRPLILGNTPKEGQPASLCLYVSL
jgi:hypothetical protein